MSLPKKYKDLIPCYSYRVQWSDEDKVFVVSVEELPGCMTHGEDPTIAMKNAYEAVEGYLETYLEDHDEVPEPLSKIKMSGEFLFRGPPELHKRLVQRQHQEGYKTLNKFLIDHLPELVANKNSSTTKAKRHQTTAKSTRLKSGGK